MTWRARKQKAGENPAVTSSEKHFFPRKITFSSIFPSSCVAVIRTTNKEGLIEKKILGVKRARYTGSTIHDITAKISVYIGNGYKNA